MRLKPPWQVHARDGVPDDVHVPFVRAALALGLVGGFTLAVTLPVQAALGRMDLSWLAHAQVHGHVQVIGFAGLFVVGVAYKLAPRFGGGRLRHPQFVALSWWCLVAGLLLRSIGQPLAHEPLFAMLLAVGALLELAGAAAFAAIVLPTLWPAAREHAAHALLMSGAALWFAGQALLGAWWLSALALEGGVVLATPRNGVLLQLQLYGFLLGTFLGVGFRSFPSFFGMPQPSRRLGLAAFALLQGGLLAVLLAGLAGERGLDAAVASSGGQLLIGGAVLLAVSAFGWWRRETRLAVASQPLAWALRATLLWLTVTGVLLFASALDAALAGRAVSVAMADVVRHVFAIGVITLGITAMAQLILPEFASERLVRSTSHWRGTGLALALSLAVVLRVAPPLGLVPGGWYFWTMAAGGVLATGAVVAFTVLLIRAWRSHAAYMQRVAAYRERSLPVVE